MNFDFLNDYIKGHSQGYVIKASSPSQKLFFVKGNREVMPNLKTMESDTLFDIASITKTFTAVLVYKTYEKGKINVNDFVYDIDNNFIHLKDVKVLDLLGHQTNIWTDGYLGDAKSKEEFTNILHSSYVKDDNKKYQDVHYIILSYLLEKIYQKDFSSIMKEEIFDVLSLKSATFKPDSQNIASCNYEYKDGEYVDFIKPGMVHDNKARKASELGFNVGNSGIFINTSDLFTFLESFLNYKLLKKETIDFMISHSDGNKENYERLKKVTNMEGDQDTLFEESLKIDKNISYLTYNNMGARYFNDIVYINDVPKNASKSSIVFSGYTGPMYLIDFDRKIIILIMCNVLHYTNLSRFDRKSITSDIMCQVYDYLISK